MHICLIYKLKSKSSVRFPYVMANYKRSYSKSCHFLLLRYERCSWPQPYFKYHHTFPCDRLVFSALCPPLWHASRWMMGDCLVIKRWHFRGRSAGICTPHHLHSSNQRLHGKVHGCLVGAVIKKELIKEGWRKSFHFFFHSHEITFVIWLHWMEGWVFYPFFPPRKTK